MNDTCISSVHIQKLGHEIVEIRERALHSIISKLERGCTFDSDLARSRELLSRLFDWFLLEPCSCEALVLQLIKRILQSESGKLLQKHYGSSTIKDELEKIKTYLEPQYHQYIDDILQNIETTKVPPLISSVPLSYRSDDTYKTINDSTATPIEGNITQKTSLEQCHEINDNNKTKNYDYFFKRYSLISQDVHVLKSIENSFKSPKDASSLLNSCEFFKDVLLQDFPAEIFLQRPAIVLFLQGLLKDCPSTRLATGVLECFLKFTHLLIVRINFFNDPSVFNNKVPSENASDVSSPVSEKFYKRNFDGLNEIDFWDASDLKQISVQRFCFSTMICLLDYVCDKPSFSDDKMKLNRKQSCINCCIRLLQELINLLSLCMQSANDPQNVSSFLNKFGDTLEFFRINLASNDSEPQQGIVHLCLLYICARFLHKINPPHDLLPVNFKIALENTLLNPIVTRLHSELHDFLLEYMEKCNSSNKIAPLSKYRQLKEICDSMSSAVEFLKHNKSKSFSENTVLAKNAILSLQFHRNLTFIKILAQTFATKMPTDPSDDVLKEDVTRIILSLLSHHSMEIKEETYTLCQQKVIATVGPKLNVKKESAPGTQILFLLQADILIEIALNGLVSENYKIQKSAEAILVYIIKCKILVSDNIWQKCVEAIIPALPILLCYADRETPIGRTVTGILDPDVGKSLFLTNLEILKGNIELLFVKDGITRNEALSRILWLLTAQENHKDFLPKINSLQDKTLNAVCQLKTVYDINKNRNTQHYYEPSNLKQVLKLLDSENVEPVIRRSALTQIGVMVEDYLLHGTFMENDGLRILLDVMKNALTEKNYQDYPDAIIPAVGILKYLCLYSASIRHELSSNFDVYCFVLRGLFLYLTEEHMKEDCNVVLFLLLFNNHINGSPANADFSLPCLVFEKLKVPFSSQTYKTTPEVDKFKKITEEFFSDKTTLSALQLHWCLEWFDGIETVLKWDSVPENNANDFDDRLLLTNYDLLLLKNSSLEYCSRKYLIDIQNSTTHLAVFEGVAKLMGCLNLFAIIKPDNNNFFYLPWEKTFKKFLTILPSGEADCTLLISVLKLISLLIPLYKTQETPCWITTLLKNPKNCLLEILEMNAEVHAKILAQELLHLIVKCVQQERNYVLVIETHQSWGSVFKIIANTLKLSDSQNFYNLAYLDCMLSALVHITGTVGWSDCNQKDVIFRTITDICELLSIFHCGKGTTATDSVMGLSVTRNLLLLLNHLLAEIFNAEFKDWETCFLNEIDENENVLRILLQLLNSRDVVLRAAVLQLFCGLCTNARMALEVVRETVEEKITIWEVAIALLLDNEEASIVRENSAALLTNLCSHLFNKNDTDSNTKVRLALNLLEDYDFYKQLKEILSSLFIKSVIMKNYTNFLATPSLIKSLTKFLCNLTTLCKEDVICNLQENGLIKQFFRSLSLPCASCENTKELAAYRDILEMNTQICILLTKSVTIEKSCGAVLLHTRDCLSVLLSFLNPTLYYTYLPELIYLRNKLWNEIFGLLAVLLANQADSAKIIANCITENYKEPFLQTVCEAISSHHSEDLQQSALTSLTSLLNVDEENSVHDILDSFRTPRNLTVEKNLESIEPFNFNANSKFKVLERAYFERTVPSSYLNNTDDFLLAGAELCKILLHLYHITTLNLTSANVKKRATVVSSLTSLLGVSREAKTYAFCHGLLEITIQQIRELHIKLSLETAECTRRIISKKRVSPLLKQLDGLIGLLTNFMLGCEEIKNRSANLNLADLIHKLWVWFCFQKIELVNVLKLLCTFTVNATAPAQSLAFTSPIAGSGPRKSPSNVTLLHAIVNQINKEMEQISRTHDLIALKLCFEILENVCVAVECRAIMAKSNLFGTFTRLHPAITKRQKPWDFVEFLWLDFLQVFTGFAEGQAAVAKIPDVLELIITLTASAKEPNRREAVYVLRNVAFYQPNRPRLLMSGEFLNVLRSKLEHGSMDEKNAVVSILWVLAANNQKGKLALKCANLDVKLQEVLKQCHILEDRFDPRDVKRMHLVLKLLRENER